MLGGLVGFGMDVRFWILNLVDLVEILEILEMYDGLYWRGGEVSWGGVGWMDGMDGYSGEVRWGGWQMIIWMGMGT